MISEKIGGAKGTEIDGQFQVMERVLFIILIELLKFKNL